jgi:ketosteroid isomerase-like protein
MSRENVEVARRWGEALNKRDLDALDHLAHDHYELHNPGTTGGGVRRGVDEVRRWAEGFFDAWQTYSLEVERIIDAGETVVVLGRVRARGKTSGVTLDAPRAYIHTIRDGRLARTQVFNDHAEGLEAVGLRG